MRPASLVVALALALAAGRVARAQTIANDPAEPQVLELVRTDLQGARVRVLVFSASPDKARAAAAAFDGVMRLEALLFEGATGSSLRHLNDSAGTGKTKLAPEVITFLSRAKQAADTTHGALALTALAYAPLWDFSPSAAHVVPEAPRLREAAALVDDTRLVVDEAAGTATLAAGMRIGADSLVVAAAATRAVAQLAESGFGNALVDVGGVIVAAGAPGERPWVVGIQDPRAAGYFASLALAANEAVATSGDYLRFFERDGVRYHDVLDPRTGLPARGCRSVTIVGQDALAAAALARGVMVAGAKGGLALIEGLPGFGAVIVSDDNQVMVSTALRARLRLVRAPVP